MTDAKDNIDELLLRIEYEVDACLLRSILRLCTGEDTGEIS